MTIKAARVEWEGGMLPSNTCGLLVVCEILSEGTSWCKGIAAYYTEDEEMVEMKEKNGVVERKEKKTEEEDGEE